MEPKQAWRALSLMVVLVDIAVAAALVDIGYSSAPVMFLALVVIVVYVYVLYKRYHVEIVPESDLRLFDDIEDLRILSRIYGTDERGNVEDVRQRLIQFVRSNGDRTFTWVAPKSVLALGSALEVPAPQPAGRPGRQEESRSSPGTPVPKRVLVGGKARSAETLSSIGECPVCNAKVARSEPVCPECGADMEFYSALSETRVGKRIVSAKSDKVRRKVRYSALSSGENR